MTMENENSPAVIKETLYDKVFKPQKITLAERPQRDCAAGAARR